MDSAELESPALDPVSADEDRLRGITSLRAHAARGTLVNGAYQMSLIGVSAARGLVAAAFMTRYAYGVWGLVGLTLWTATAFKSVFGANEKYVQQSHADPVEGFQLAFTIEAIYAAALIPIAAAIAFAFTRVTGHPAVLAPALALLGLIPAATLQFPIAIFYRRLDYRRQKLLLSVEPLVASVVTLVLAVLHFGYWSFVIGGLAGAWAGAAIALKVSPYPLALRYRRGTLRSYVGFSAPLLVSAVATLGVFNVIYLVGSGPLRLAGLGAFTLVGNLVQFTDQADAIITDTLYPAVCAVKDRLELLAEAFVKSNRLSLMWAVPFGVGLALFAPDLVHLALGARWAPAIPLLQIMGIVTALHHVGYNWGAFFKARGRTWPMAIASVPTSITTIAAAIPLMYADGLTGLGLAFAAGEVAGLISRGTFIARMFGGFRIQRQLGRAFAPVAVAATSVLALRALIGPERTGISGLAVLVLYVAVCAAATYVFEGSLIREAWGYLVARRLQATG
jgi:O-antigen/teichoic acid export membrane protein